MCYGKTLGGGLPIGVVCGPTDLMARGDSKKAARVNYVRASSLQKPFQRGHRHIRWPPLCDGQHECFPEVATLTAAFGSLRSLCGEVRDPRDDEVLRCDAPALRLTL